MEPSCRRLCERRDIPAVAHALTHSLNHSTKAKYTLVIHERNLVHMIILNIINTVNFDKTITVFEDYKTISILYEQLEREHTFHVAKLIGYTYCHIMDGSRTSYNI